MADSTVLRYGGYDINFRKSATQIAIRPVLGRSRDMEYELESLTKGFSVVRQGRLGPFEIVESHRVRLDRLSSVQKNVPVYHTSDDEVPFVPEGTIFLSFKTGTSVRDIEELITRYDLTLISVTVDKFYTVYSPAVDALEVSAKLQQEEIVSIAEPDLITPRRLLNIIPDDEFLDQQWHLENRGEYNGTTTGLKKGADARVIAAWKLLGNLGEESAVIAIIDDGFDLMHPDFHNKTVHPWDFIRGSNNVQPEPDLHSAQAGDWHGTACAGVALGIPGGGAIVGAAPNAKLLPVRMTDHLSPCEVEKWFNYVTDKGAWVVSCSWNARAKVWPLTKRIEKAIERCATQGRDGKGCVVIFAAGNAGLDINDPPNSQNGFAIHPDVIAVAASTSLDRQASYSDFGKEIAVCAPSGGFPGWNIVTSDVTGTYIDAAGVQRSSGYAAGAYYTGFDGTSSSCPLVAGICSLVLSANSELTAAQVRQIIRTTARKIGDEADYQNGHSVKFGYGCINAEAAVDMAKKMKSNGNLPLV